MEENTNMPAQTEKKKHAGGRPTKYKKEYCDDIIEYFGIEPFIEREINYTNKDGDVYKTEYVKDPNKLPFLTKFARTIGVDIRTLERWTEKYPRFSRAYKAAKEMQQEFLIENGLRGLYNASSFIFTAKNITDMRDQKDVNIDANIKGSFGVIQVPVPLKEVEIGKDYSALGEGGDANVLLEATGSVETPN